VTPLANLSRITTEELIAELQSRIPGLTITIGLDSPVQNGYAPQGQRQQEVLKHLEQQGSVTINTLLDLMPSVSHANMYSLLANLRRRGIVTRHRAEGHPTAHVWKLVKEK
jgi:hypothetical protein